MARLRGFINDLVTTIEVDDTTSLPTNGGVVLIETELVRYTYASDKAILGCERGFNSTTPASHDDGTLLTVQDTVATLYGLQEYNDHGTPTDHLTGVGFAPKGTRYTDLDTSTIYLNTSDETDPIWVAVGSGSGGSASGPAGAVQLSDGAGAFNNDPALSFTRTNGYAALSMGGGTEYAQFEVVTPVSGGLSIYEPGYAKGLGFLNATVTPGSIFKMETDHGDILLKSFNFDTPGIATITLQAESDVILDADLVKNGSGVTLLNPSTHVLFDGGSAASIDFNNRLLLDGLGATTVDFSQPGLLDIYAKTTVIKDDFGALYVHNVANDKAFRVDSVNGWSVLTDSIGDTAVTLGATPPNGQTPVGLDVQTHVDSGVTLREGGGFDGWTLRRQITSAYGEFILGLADNTIEWEFHQDGTTLFPGNRFSLQNTGPGTILDLNASNASFIDFNSDDTLTNYATITAGGDTGGDLLIKSTLNRLGLWSNGFAAYIDGGITDATSWTLDAGGNNLQFKTVNATMYLEAGNQGVRVPVGTGNPSDTVAGSIYFNTSTNHFFGYDGSTWKQLDN